MNVIFEGPDNVGKGTTIELFRNKYNHIAWSNIYYTGVKMPKEKQYSYMVNLFGKMWKLFEQDNIISDRSHISEAVFAEEYRDMKPGSIDMLFMQEKYYLKSGGPKTVLIMLIDTPEHLLEREDGLSHSQTTEDKQKELDLYLKYFKRSKLPKILIDVNGKSPCEVIEQIDGELKKIERK